jgi:hypothetical protein
MPRPSRATFLIAGRRRGVVLQPRRREDAATEAAAEDVEMAPADSGKARERANRTTAMASKIGPFFATPHHAPIELPEQVLTMIVLLLPDSTSAFANAEAGSLYAGLMGGIGSVCRSWRRLLKGVLMGDELAWLTVQGAAEAAECLSSFPHAKSLRIVGDAAAGEIVSALGSGSVARLAIANNSVVRDCEGLGQLVGLRALYITKCRNLESLVRMTQLTSLDLSGTLCASASPAL